MNYGEVLTRAWKIIWKFKALWIFGLLASCGTSGPNLNYQFSSGDLSPRVQQMFGSNERFFSDYWWVIALFIMLLCVIIVVVILLNTIGRIALIKGTLKAEKGAEHMGFVELFNDSLPYFWRVLGLSVLLFIVFFFVFMFAGLIAAAATVLTFGIALVCLVPLCCLLIPLMWVISVILEQAYIAIVVEDRGLFDGLARGWEVAKTHWEPMLVMGVILIFGAAIIGFVLAVPFFIILFPVFFAMGIARTGSTAIIIVSAICLLAYLPVLLLLRGILKSYVQSAWTLTYLRVTGRGPSLEAVAVGSDASLPPLQSANA